MSNELVQTEQDHGLQNERTVLAWRRTTLSLVAGAAIMTRLEAHAGNAATSALWLWAGALGGIALLALSVVRHQRGERSGHESDLAGLCVTLATAIVVLEGCVLSATLIARGYF